MGVLESVMVGEVTLHSGPASLVRVDGSGAAGTSRYGSVELARGTLTLTNASLKFEPVAGFASLSIPLADIARVELGNSAVVVPDRLVVVRRDGRKHAIVVRDRDGWAGRIRALVQLRA